MSPTYSKAAVRLLISVLLVSSAANAAALPHQVLDAREAAAEVAEFPAAQFSAAPDNVFEEVEDILKSRTALQLVQDFFARLFGFEDDNQQADEPVTTTVFVTATSIQLATSAASSVALVTPPGPSSTSVEVTTEIVASNTSIPETTPTPEPTDMMSILPVGSLTTAINVTLPDPVFQTDLPLAPSTFVVLIPPFPVNTTAASLLPTAVLITDEFTAIPPSTAALPLGTGLPSTNETVEGTATITANLTSTIVVTATVIPIPIGTGDVSAGTGLAAFTDAATGLYPNITTSIPTQILSTGAALQGTGVSNATVSEAPLFPNTTFSIPTAILSTGDALQGTGISDATVTELPLFPNMTLVLPTMITVTGGSAGILNATIPVTVAPFENTTFSTPTPILGTGSPDTADVTVTFEDVPLFPNATLVLSTVIPGTGAPVAATATGSPISFTDAPLYANTTETLVAALPGTGTGVPSAGVTGAVVIIDPIYPNVSTTTTTTTIAGADVSILPSGTGIVITPSQSVEFPG
jgi:hypothetical protein